MLSRPLTICSIALATFVSYTVSIFVSDNKYLDIQHNEQLGLGDRAVNNLILDNIQRIDDSGRIFTNYPWLIWLPNIPVNKYINCTDDNCLSRELDIYSRSLVLSNGIYPVFEKNPSKYSVLGVAGGYTLFYTAGID
ncbi:hypothetical protein [Lentilitoribacter sp. EG35]|uniref:hypothetical protein n=1 Tax=Lentilitoribacter sp. EG35 TaxID=3234192 RepID=UPI003460E520